jgi:hypothetical protein
MRALLWLYSYGSLIYIQNYLTGHLVLAKLKTASIKKNPDWLSKGGNSLYKGDSYIFTTTMECLV